MGYPKAPFEFLLQLDNYLFIDGPAPTPDAVGCSVYSYTSVPGGSSTDEATAEPHQVRPNAPWGILHERGASEYYFDFTNLGTDGTVYVFIDRTAKPPRVCWFWNR